MQDKAELWNTGKLKSKTSVMVPYRGKTLTARSLCYWRVRVWDAKKQASSWSPVAVSYTHLDVYKRQDDGLLINQYRIGRFGSDRLCKPVYWCQY